MQQETIRTQHQQQETAPREYHVGVGDSRPFYITLYLKLATQMYWILRRHGYNRAYLREVPSHQTEALRREFSS